MGEAPAVGSRVCGDVVACWVGVVRVGGCAAWVCGRSP